MAFLLDTNVISELRKGTRCHPRVLAWRQAAVDEETFLSVLVFGELRRGIERLRRKDISSAQILERWLRGLRLTYAERILPVTFEICDRWGRLSTLQPMPATDGLLAATALHYDLTLVTRNTADFQRSGVDYLNPFED
jgi:predicted nucleic acid-binding protein